MAYFIINPKKELVLRNTYDSTGQSPDKPALLWIDEDVHSRLRILHKRYGKRAIEIYGGRTRNVFVFNKHVVKIPKNSDGCYDNEWESCISNSEEGLLHTKDYVQYTRTRLAYYERIPVLFMQRVVPMEDAEIKTLFGFVPDWVNSVDSGQVGTTIKGRLVAYDYGRM
jgi:hypothetical protein